MNRHPPPPLLPPPPPPSDAWGFATSLAFPGQSRPQEEIEKWLATSGITVVERGDRYFLASRGWAWGVLDLNTRTWVRWFEKGNAVSRAWLLWDSLEHRGGTPFWRSANPLWITLHVLLGLVGLGFLVAMLGYALAVGSGQDPERIGAHELPVVVAWLSPLWGWLAFVYTRQSLGARIRFLVGAIVLGAVAWLLSTG